MGLLRKPLTDEEDKALKEAVAAGTSLQRLAVRFKRPADKIKRRAKDLGLAIAPTARLPRGERA